LNSIYDYLLKFILANAFKLCPTFSSNNANKVELGRPRRLASGIALKKIKDIEQHGAIAFSI